MTTPIAPDRPTLATFLAPYRDANAVGNPESDLGSLALNRIVAQVVAVGMTNPIAWARCTISGSTITLADHSAVWGDTNAVKPTTARTSAGLYTVTWATTYFDLQAVPEEHSVNIRNAAVSGYGAAGMTFQRQITSTRQVTVRTYNSLFAATDCTEFEIRIW